VNISELAVAIIGAVGVIVAAVLGVPRIARDSRWQIQRDLEIYTALPDSSGSKPGLLAKIDREVALLDRRDLARRDPSGIGLAIAFLVIGLALVWLTVSSGRWWWTASPITAGLLVFGIVGLCVSGPKKIRDEKGNALASAREGNQAGE
jgi:hypothetical protein